MKYVTPQNLRLLTVKIMQQDNPPFYQTPQEQSVRMYLAHIHAGQSLREIAHDVGLSPSSVLRRIRKIEDCRDDPLIEAALNTMTSQPLLPSKTQKDCLPMKHHASTSRSFHKLSKEKTRILRRLSETGAFLAIGHNVTTGVVFRKTGKKPPTKTAVVRKEIAQQLVLNDFIRLEKKQELLSIYHITPTGRAALKRTLSDDETAFGDQHREWGERNILEEGMTQPTRMRVNLRESPLSALARKKDRTGQPFLSQDLINAGERLREDFELSQLGPRITQNWEQFITGGNRGGGFRSYGEGGSAAAQRRFANALSVLGVGLGDIALRCCCYLEGLETAEKRLGWSARSGKIVLRIALHRLDLHYKGSLRKEDYLIG